MEREDSFLSSISGIFRSAPYLLFASATLPAITLIFGWLYGGKRYLFVSLAVFAAHLVARRTQSKVFDYPVSFGRFGSLRKPLLSGSLLSLVLGFFVSGYTGIIPKEFIISFEKVLTMVFGEMVLIFILSIPLFLGLIYIVSISIKTKSKWLALLWLAAAAAWMGLLSKADLNSVASSSWYLYIAGFLFGVPSLLVARMLFLGFSTESYEEIFSKKSKNPVKSPPVTGQEYWNNIRK